MKINIKNTVVAFMVIFFVSSCEDWLDETSSAEITSEDQFDSEQGFMDALIGVYIGMTVPELYAKDMTWNLVDILSRQYEPLPTTTSGLYSQVQEYNYRGTLSTTQIDNLWIKTYNVIANANNALNLIDTKKDVLDPINYAVIKGELLGLRAFLHFDLMRLYGLGNLANRTDVGGKLAVPYVTQFTKEPTRQRSYEETFDLMENDINEALGFLREDPIYTGADRPSDYYDDVNRNGFYDNREQRMNYYAVKALQARVLSWQGGTENMEAARLAAEEVITESPAMLIASASYPIATDPILYPEVLFSLNVTALEDITIGFLDAATEITNGNALFLSQNTAEALYETNNVNIGVADIRFNTLLKTQARGLVSIKLLQNDITYRNQVPLMKLPEMYYIVAEYYLGKSNLTAAITNLNTVRSSRGIIDDIPDTATQEEVRAELIKEYRKEYIGEGQLFFFYKRLGLTTYPGISTDIVVGDDIYVLPYPDSEIQ